MIPEEKRHVHYGTPNDDEFEERMSKERAEYMAKAYPNIYKDKKVLDLGCGFGTAAKYLAEKYNCDVIGLDANPEALEVCNKRNAHPKVKYIKGFVFEIPLEDESLDIINFVETIEHVDFDERDMCLKECRRVLKNDGLLYITTPEMRGTKNNFPNGSHFTEYTFEEITEIIENFGFKLVQYFRKNRTDGISMALLFEKENVI